MKLSEHPISSIQWLDVDSLSANDYNPNVVIGPEFKLLKLSLLKQGWIQPVLVVKEGDAYTIIDGFHRSTLCRADPEVRALTGGKVPCAVMEMSVPDRMLLTVRINRAKGSHVAIKMHEMVTRLVEEFGLSKEEVAKQIGATIAEIDLLLTENVFKKLDIPNHPYSKAWTIRTE